MFLALVRETLESYRLTLPRRNGLSGPTPDSLGESLSSQNPVLEKILSIVPAAKAGRLGNLLD